MKSYNYANREGVKKISWQEFGTLSANLAEKLEVYKPQAIVGIARAGLFPATSAACYLRLELFPVRVTRRVNDLVVYKTPKWKVPVSSEVESKVVAVVDEIADSGETLKLVREQILAKGALKCITSSLVSHSWADPIPDVTVLVSDALIIFPWDREILKDGKWQMHPEIKAAIGSPSKSHDN